MTSINYLQQMVLNYVPDNPTKRNRWNYWTPLRKRPGSLNNLNWYESVTDVTV